MSLEKLENHIQELENEIIEYKNQIETLTKSNFMLDEHISSLKEENHHLQITCQNLKDEVFCLQTGHYIEEGEQKYEMLRSTVNINCSTSSLS